MLIPHPSFRCLLLALGCAVVQLNLSAAETLSRSYDLDFFRDIPSRNLKGLAASSDGRLVSGPELRDLEDGSLPDLLWTLEPAGKNVWLIGTGPDGKIVEVTLSADADSFSSREIIDLDEPQVLAIRRLDNGELIAGTSPNGTLFLIRDGKVTARAGLPVDSVFDIAIKGGKAYVATGNPGKIYEVDLQKFRAGGVSLEKLRKDDELGSKGIRTFGEVRDRNVRRIAWLGDRLIAGSSPRGNVYAFTADSTAPEILQENREAEVAALLPQPNGDFYAALVFAAVPGENRINRPKTEGETTPAPPPQPADRFGGRSTVVYFPQSGFPETIVARPNLAFYALARRNDTLIIAGGEQGDVLGYDITTRQSLSFPGSDSSQLNALVPIDSSETGATSAQKFLALRNNSQGLAILDFAASGPRVAETRRMELGIPSKLGALRISRLRNVTPEQLRVDVKTNLGSDEIEGWSAWQPTQRRADGWMGRELRARNIKLRFQIENARDAAVEMDEATLFFLPQNRRPQLGEFRVIAPNYTLIPAPEPSPTVVTTLNQLINAPADRDDKRRSALLNSQVAPQPGMQIVTWNVTDPDGDAVACTFSVRREGAEDWTDLAINSREGFVQFDTLHMEDGVYSTKLVATEQDPRPADDRLTALFDTGELLIDHTPPTISEADVKKENGGLRITIAGRDALSLLEGAEFLLNNGHREQLRHPSDSIRDSQTETFSIWISAATAANATAVELILYDSVGNSTAKRLTLP